MNELVELRLRAGLTQEQLAARSGVAQPNIAAYESGRRKASGRMLERLAAAARPLPHEVLASRGEEIRQVARRHGMTEIGVFGSAVRGEDTVDSDLDLLVRPPAGAGLLALSAFALELEDLLGLRVDVVTRASLRPGHPILTESRSL